MAVTTTTISAVLKRLYSKEAIENAVYDSNPLYALMPKKGDIDGEGFLFTIRYRDSLGNSPTFATAQASAQDDTKGTFKNATFALTTTKEYQLYTLETEAILKARRDPAAFVNALKTEADAALHNFGRSQAFKLYRDGAGERGQVSAVSGAGPYTFTMAKTEEIANLEVGMTVVFSNGSTKTAALRNSGGGVVITLIDRMAGTFTTATNPDSGAANDWVFVKGERATGVISATDYLNLSGLEAWVPSAAPGATSFFGVDRSVDATRLGGLRADISTYSPEEGLVLAAHIAAREGAKGDYLFCSFTDSVKYHHALGSRVQTESMQVGKLGFETIKVHGPRGLIRIVPDINCPANVGWLLDINTWCLRHVGDLPNMLDLDGAVLSREASADRFEGRMVAFSQVQCSAPGKNMRLVLPS